MRANLIIHLRSSPKGEEYVRALLDDYDSICSKYDKRLEARAQEMNLELLKCAQQNITDEESASSAGLITETGLRDIHKIVEEILHDTLHARPVLEAKAGDWRTWFWHHAEEMIRSPRQEVEQNWGQIREHLLGGKEFNLWPLPDLDQEYP
ncbi:hypothetical protein MMC10_005844 [Thelotrema lepadinum]|nr:hypothetical protein [Thelotrema lepadinum]